MQGRARAARWRAPGSATEARRRCLAPLCADPSCSDSAPAGVTCSHNLVPPTLLHAGCVAGGGAGGISGAQHCGPAAALNRQPQGAREAQGSRIEQWGTGGLGKSSGSMMCQVVSSSMMSSVCSGVQRAWARGGRWGEEEAQQHQQRASVCPSGWVCGCQRCCSLDGPGAGAPLPLEGPRRGARSGPGSCLMDWPQCLPRTFSRFCSTASSVICCSSRERGRARRRGGASAALIVASSRQMP